MITLVSFHLSSCVNTEETHMYLAELVGCNSLEYLVTIKRLSALTNVVVKVETAVIEVTP